MPQSEPQTPTAQASPKSHPPAGTPSPEPAAEEFLFRTLVDAGCDPVVAYTADRRARRMFSEVATAEIQPILAELRQLRATMVNREDLAGFATKADLAGFATKADLAGFATKADLANCATKADLANCATKADLDRLRAEMVKWVFGALMAQTAVLVALLFALVRSLT